MSKTLEVSKKEVHVADIVHHGEKVVLPEDMKIQDAIALLQRRMTYLEEATAMSETFDVFPWDGAHALDLVLTEKYGWTPQEAIMTMFGPDPPKLISIEVDYGVLKSVPWGAFALPGVEGQMQTSAAVKDGRVCFKIESTVKRKCEADVKDIFVRVRQKLKEVSIYRGKAFKMRFCDDDGDRLRMPEPKFMNTRDIDEGMLVFPKHVTDAVETSLFTPIQRVRELAANGIPIKRGVLLGGTFGTGKTLAARVAARFAVDVGVTFLYVQRADELAAAIDFAMQYDDPACVIFCEDIDRATEGERSVEIDDLLNQIDGIDTKSARIITVLTTNNLEAINTAMLRPGRLDAVIHVTPPDAEAVEKLLRLYGGAAIDAGANLKPAAKELDGQIPAVIAEVVKRAKLAELRRQPKGKTVQSISSAALLESAQTMAMQLALLNRTPLQEPPTLENAMRDVVRTALNGQVDEVRTDVRKIREHVGA